MENHTVRVTDDVSDHEMARSRNPLEIESWFQQSTYRKSYTPNRMVT